MEKTRYVTAAEAALSMETNNQEYVTAEQAARAFCGTRGQERVDLTPVNPNGYRYLMQRRKQGLKENRQQGSQTAAEQLEAIRSRHDRRCSK